MTKKKKGKTKKQTQQPSCSNHLNKGTENARQQNMEFLVQMRQTNKCGSVRNVEIIKLHLGSGGVLESASPASCKTPGKFTDSIRPKQSTKKKQRIQKWDPMSKKSYCTALAYVHRT